MPGVNSRFCPRESALLIAWIESVGRATKKLFSATVRPAVWPEPQVTPSAFVRTDGTRTSYAPPEPTNRYGFSRLVAVVGRVVYGGLGNESGGAPATPEKTWFHTPLLQLP